MITDRAVIESARAALTEFDAPRCRRLMGRSASGRSLCSLPVGHRGPHRATYYEPSVDHLRAALAEVEEITAERDRLRAILACERGEWAPEGWSWLVDDNFNAMLVGTVRDAAGWPVTVRRTVPRGWSADGGRTVHSFALLAAEAIEAAIRLEVMVAGGYPARERGGAS